MERIGTPQQNKPKKTLVTTLLMSGQKEKTTAWSLSPVDNSRLMESELAVCDEREAVA